MTYCLNLFADGASAVYGTWLAAGAWAVLISGGCLLATQGVRMGATLKRTQAARSRDTREEPVG